MTDQHESWPHDKALLRLRDLLAKAEARIAELNSRIARLIKENIAAEARVMELEADIDDECGWRESCEHFKLRAEAAERELASLKADKPQTRFKDPLELAEESRKK